MGPRMLQNKLIYWQTLIARVVLPLITQHNSTVEGTKPGGLSDAVVAAFVFPEIIK